MVSTTRVSFLHSNIERATSTTLLGRAACAGVSDHSHSSNPSFEPYGMGVRAPTTPQDSLLMKGTTQSYSHATPVIAVLA